MGNMIILTDAPEPEKPAPVMPTTNTPGDVLKIAIERGSDVDQLERLLNLELRWKAYQAELAYQQDFLAFKQEPGLKILRDEVVDFVSKRTGERTNYKYSPLDKAESVLIPLLARHNFTHHWKTEPQADGWTKVTCVIKHVLCHENAEASLVGPPDITGAKNAHQAIGSNVSFLQRYTLCAACGITPRNVDRDARVETIETAGETIAAVCETTAQSKEENLTPELAASVKIKLEEKVNKAKDMEALKKLWNAFTEEQRAGLREVFSARRKALEVVHA